jgi:hypothetical protein
MRYLLYLVRTRDGMSLVLLGEGQSRPRGETQLVRRFASREEALEAMASLRSEFVFPDSGCFARTETEAG